MSSTHFPTFYAAEAVNKAKAKANNRIIKQMSNRPTGRPTDQPMDTASYRGALVHLRRLRRDIVSLICILQLYSDLERKNPGCSFLRHGWVSCGSLVH